MNIEKELAKRLMDEGESGNRQVAYNHEISFYELVASGNMHRLEEALKTIGSTQTLGILSPDKLRNVKYHTVILTAKAGTVVNLEDAFDLTQMKK